VTFDVTLHTGHSVYNFPTNQEIPSSYVTQSFKTVVYKVTCNTFWTNWFRPSVFAT